MVPSALKTNIYNITDASLAVSRPTSRLMGDPPCQIHAGGKSPPPTLCETLLTTETNKYQSQIPVDPGEICITTSKHYVHHDVTAVILLLLLTPLFM
jgi:hypothetical protein